MDQLLASFSGVILLLIIVLSVIMHVIGDVRELAQIRFVSKNKHKPKVSIYITVTNSRIFDTLNSIQNTSYRNMEVVLRLKTKSKRISESIEVLTTQKNSYKLSVITNSGSQPDIEFVNEYTSGKYILKLNQGDILNAKFITDNVAILKQKHFDALTGYIEHDINNSLHKGLLDSRESMRSYFHRVLPIRIKLNPSLHPHVIYKKSLLLDTRNLGTLLNSVHVNSCISKLAIPSETCAREIMALRILYLSIFALVIMIDGLVSALILLLISMYALVLVATLSWPKNSSNSLVSRLSSVMLAPFSLLF